MFDMGMGRRAPQVQAGEGMARPGGGMGMRQSVPPPSPNVGPSPNFKGGPGMKPPTFSPDIATQPGWGSGRFSGRMGNPTPYPGGMDRQMPMMPGGQQLPGMGNNMGGPGGMGFQPPPQFGGQGIGPNPELLQRLLQMAGQGGMQAGNRIFGR